MAVHTVGGTSGMGRPCNVYFHFVSSWAGILSPIPGNVWSYTLHNRPFDKQGCTPPHTVLYEKSRDWSTFVSTHGKQPHEI